jgi:hypothetical protein
LISSEVLLPHPFDAAGFNFNARQKVWLTAGRGKAKGAAAAKDTSKVEASG